MRDSSGRAPKGRAAMCGPLWALRRRVCLFGTMRNFRCMRQTFLGSSDSRPQFTAGKNGRSKIGCRPTLASMTALWSQDPGSYWLKYR